MATQDEGRWQDRRVLALAVRACVALAPLVVAVLVVQAANVVFAPRTWTVVQELLLMAPLALAAALATERALRRFLPLAMLLRMDMAFPGRAPSRFAVARQARSQDQLMAMLAERDAGPQQAARAMMTLLAALAGHDRRTRGHSERTRVLADVLGAELKLTRHDRDRLRWAALLHDVGKLEIAPRILNKPSPLNQSEWRRMQLHPEHGAELTSALSGWLGLWADGILHHHERFDGSGYPGGIAGEEISLAGRVISVVDAYESMTASRPYQRARATREARHELVRCAGTHFDPDVVRAFLAISMPRLLWATGALALLTHLPYMRDLQLIGQQATSVAGAQVATAAGVTAMAVSASAVPAWTAHDPVPAPAAVQSQMAAEVPVARVTAAPDDVDVAPPHSHGVAPVAAIGTVVGPTVEDVSTTPGAESVSATGADQDKAAKDEAAKDKAAKDKAAKDKAAKDKAAKDKAAKDKAAKDKAAKDKAAKDKAAKDKAGKDKAAKDEKSRKH